MALRKGHGHTGKGQPRIEVLPVDEMLPGKRAEGLTPMQITRIKQGLSRDLGRLDGVFDPPPGFKPFWDLAVEWRKAHAADLALQVGGGVVGPGPLAILSSATIQYAMSRYLVSMGMRGDTRAAVAGTRLMDQHRQNMLACHELVAREAAARAEARIAPKKSLEQLLLESGEEP